MRVCLIFITLSLPSSPFSLRLLRLSHECYSRHPTAPAAHTWLRARTAVSVVPRPAAHVGSATAPSPPPSPPPVAALPTADAASSIQCPGTFFWLSLLSLLSPVLPRRLGRPCSNPSGHQSACARLIDTCVPVSFCTAHQLSYSHPLPLCFLRPEATHPRPRPTTRGTPPTRTCASPSPTRRARASSGSRGRSAPASAPSTAAGASATTGPRGPAGGPGQPWTGRPSGQRGRRNWSLPFLESVLLCRADGIFNNATHYYNDY